jgi:hypothetical protein
MNPMQSPNTGVGRKLCPDPSAERLGSLSGSLPPLTEWQIKKLDMLSRGYALDAAPRQFNKADRAQMEDLVARGLARRTSGAAWNKHGAYVKAENAQAETHGRRSDQP